MKAVGKLLKGDAKGALNEVKKTPLYKEGESLVKSVKQVGEGIVTGDAKKIGSGLFGLATNDLLGFIPGEKALAIGAKAIKSGIKNTVEKTAKKDAKPAKDDIVDKSFKDKKGEEKAKQDKENKKCTAKKTRRRRAADPNDDKCDKKDEDKKIKCGQPNYLAGNGNDVLSKTLKACKDDHVGERCQFLCNAGFIEKPKSLLCQKVTVGGKSTGKWDAEAGCEAQPCRADGFIFVESSTILSVLDTKKGNTDVLLYLVKFDETKKLPKYSVAYTKYSMTNAKFNSRKDSFRIHPCARLAKLQTFNSDYSKKGGKNPLSKN